MSDSKNSDEEVTNQAQCPPSNSRDNVPLTRWTQFSPSDPTIACTFRDLKFGTVAGGPELIVRSANMVRVSKYICRLLVENAHKFIDRPVTNLYIGLTYAKPEVLRMVFHWADHEQILETHTLAEYRDIPAGHETSPWMRLIALYHEADRFEMDSLRYAIFFKITEMSFAVDVVPCGALRRVYASTRKGDGLRRLFIDLTVDRVDFTEYPIYFGTWSREILQDLLIAVRKGSRHHATYCCGPDEYLKNPLWTQEHVLRQWRELAVDD